MKNASRGIIHYRSSPLASSRNYLEHGSSSEIAETSLPKEVSDLVLSLSTTDIKTTLDMSQIQNWALHHIDTGLDSITIDWNVFADHSEEEFVGLFLAIFIKEGFIKSPRAAEALLRYTETIRAGYHTTPYHNFYHAIDVTCMTYYLLRHMGIKDQADLTSIDTVGLLIAAIGHDVLHPGTNNVYQVNSNSEFAQKYGDKSVLEKLSLDFIKDTLESTELIQHITFGDIPDTMAREDIHTAVIEVISEAVIQTDMTYHFTMLDALGKYSDYLDDLAASRRGSALNLSETPINPKSNPLLLQRALSSTESLCKLPIPDGHVHQLIVNSVLHAADISNPARPFTICSKWSELVIEEFYRQGDLELASDLPVSPNMDRSKTDPIKVQLAFSDFIVKPFFEILSEIFPRTLNFLDILLYNAKQWSTLAYPPSSPELASDSSPDTISSSPSTTGSLSPNKKLGNIPFFPHRKMPSAPVDSKQPNIPYNSHMNPIAGASRRMSLAAGTIELPEDFDRFYNRRNSKDRQRNSGTSSPGLSHLSPSPSFSKTFSNSKSYQMRSGQHSSFYSKSNLSFSDYSPHVSETALNLNDQRASSHPHSTNIGEAIPPLSSSVLGLQSSSGDLTDAPFPLGPKTRRRSKSTGDAFFPPETLGGGGLVHFSRDPREKVHQRHDDDSRSTYKSGSSHSGDERYLMPNSVSFQSSIPSSSGLSVHHGGSTGDMSFEEYMKGTGLKPSGSSGGMRSSTGSTTQSRAESRQSTSGAPNLPQRHFPIPARHSTGTPPPSGSRLTMEKRNLSDLPPGVSVEKGAHFRRKVPVSHPVFSSISSCDGVSGDEAEQQSETHDAEESDPDLSLVESTPLPSMGHAREPHQEESSV